MVAALEKERKELRKMWPKDKIWTLLLLLWQVQGIVVGIRYRILSAIAVFRQNSLIKRHKAD